MQTDRETGGQGDKETWNRETRRLGDMERETRRQGDRTRGDKEICLDRTERW
jgi:hypothetical protein